MSELLSAYDQWFNSLTIAGKAGMTLLTVAAFGAVVTAIALTIDWLQHELRAQAISAAHREVDSGFGCCKPHYFLCDRIENLSSIVEKPLVLGHHIDPATPRYTWSVFCRYSNCQHTRCPWRKLIRQDDLARQVLVYRDAPDGVWVPGEFKSPEEAARAYPHLCDAYGNVAGVYDLDPKRSIGEIINTICAARDGDDVAVVDCAFGQPDGANAEMRATSPHPDPCRCDAEDGADGTEHEAHPLSPVRHDPSLVRQSCEG